MYVEGDNANSDDDSEKELPFSHVFGQMIEDAVNELNDIDVVYGELENITECSDEAAESLRQSYLSQKDTR